MTRRWFGGTMKELGALYLYCTGRAINAAGLVVGSANVRSPSTRMVYGAVVFGRGAPVDLNRLIPTRSGWVLSEATAVNDAGQIVGYGTLLGADHGFLLTPHQRHAFGQQRLPRGLALFCVGHAACTCNGP